MRIFLFVYFLFISTAWSQDSLPSKASDEVLNKVIQKYLNDRPSNISPDPRIIIARFDGLSSHPIDSLGNMDKDYLIVLSSIISFTEMQGLPSHITSFNNIPVFVYSGIEHLIEFSDEYEKSVKRIFNSKYKNRTYPPSEEVYIVKGSVITKD